MPKTEIQINLNRMHLRELFLPMNKVKKACKILMIKATFFIEPQQIRILLKQTQVNKNSNIILTIALPKIRETFCLLWKIGWKRKIRL